MQLHFVFRTQTDRVPGPVPANREAGAASSLCFQFVQGDGLDGFGTEPEEDYVRDAEVLVFPGGLLPCRFHMAGREIIAARVEDDGRGADRVHLEHRPSDGTQRRA